MTPQTPMPLNGGHERLGGRKSLLEVEVYARINVI